MLHRLLVSAVALTLVAGAAAMPAALARPGPQAAWTAIATPPNTVSQTSAAFLKGKVYVPGGWMHNFADALGKMQVYATKTDTWNVDKQAMPSGPMAQPAVCTDGSKVYAVGGIAQSGQLLSGLQVYD